MHSLSLILSRLRYFSPTWVFASLNIVIGTWVLYIPYIKQKLAINDAELGVALFFYALGDFVIIPFAPFLIKKFGIGKCTGIGIILFGIAFLFPIQASTYVWLCFALFVVGIFSGITNISMNALVSEIEKEDHVNFMSASHGFFSFGGVLGAGIGSIFLLTFKFPVWHLFTAVAFVIITNLIFMKSYFFQIAYQPEKVKFEHRFKKFKPLLGLACIAVIIMGSEGSIEHWSKLFLLDVAHVANEKLAGFGFVIFSIMMMLGRFFGDGISQKIGSLNIILLGCTLAILGYFLVLTKGIPFVIGGFGLIGLGFSVIVPEIYRLAGNTKGISSSSGISFVSGIGLLGFLGGPVILGLISELAGLKMSFIALFIAVVVALITTFIIKTKNSK